MHCTHVTNHLSVVESDDRGADKIGSGWEVDNSGSSGRGSTILSTSVLIGYGAVDGRSIIGDTVSFSTIVLYVSPDLFTALIKGEVRRERSVHTL